MRTSSDCSTFTFETIWAALGGFNIQHVQSPNDFPAVQEGGAFGHRKLHQVGSRLEVGSNSDLHSALVIMSKESS